MSPHGESLGESLAGWHTAPCGSGAKRPFSARLEGLGAPPPMEAATRDCSYPVPTPRGRGIRRRYLAFAGFACCPGSRARRPDFDLHAVCERIVAPDGFRKLSCRAACRYAARRGGGGCLLSRLAPWRPEEPGAAGTR